MHNEKKFFQEKSSFHNPGVLNNENYINGFEESEGIYISLKMNQEKNFLRGPNAT